MGLGCENIQPRESQIIESSELGRFIDEPVKTHSSGMQVRLGFSIATGFESIILIIDEGLAVGDQRFQKKCTDRICPSSGLEEQFSFFRTISARFARSALVLSGFIVGK